MTIDPGELGRAVRRIRKLRGLTQEATAQLAGVSANYLSLLENGQRGATLDTLNALAQVLGIPTSFLTFLGSTASSERADSPAFSRLLEATKATIITAIAADAQLKSAD